MMKLCKSAVSAFAILTCIPQLIQAQTPDDALRSSWYNTLGTARSTAIGGAIGALGGDISSANTNPAGLGLYKSREFVFSPGFLMNRVNSNYRDSASSSSKSGVEYGPIGFVTSGLTGLDHGKISNAFAISVSQIASYNNRVSYSGYNNYSTYAQQFVEELVADGADTLAAENNYINGSSLAYWTYLVDNVRNSNGDLIGYKHQVPVATGIYQQYDAITRGGIHEISIAFAGNHSDRYYIGTAIGIPLADYHRQLTYRESDATNNPDNNFNYSQYTEKFNSTGSGVNLKIGLIYKVGSLLRLGFAFHTPSLMSYSDNLRASMTTDTEKYAGVQTQSSDGLNSGNSVDRKYHLRTPYKMIASAALVLRQSSDTRQQRGFLSADVEYTNHRGTRYSSGQTDDPAGDAYYKALNATIKSYLKNAFNFRVGGELKFDPWMIRAGVAYYGSPYQDKALNASRTQYSGGIGYRYYGIFLDLTYAYVVTKDVNFPYRLNNAANTFANTNQKRGNIVATVGLKL